MDLSVPADGEEPILVGLAAVGFDVGSLAELRRSGVRYREAIPVLVDWLGRASDSKVKVELVRALSVPWAKPLATATLIGEFRAVDAEVDPTGTGLRWTIGNALEVLFDDADLNAFVELALDERYGKARQMVVLGLAKSKDLTSSMCSLAWSRTLTSMGRLSRRWRSCELPRPGLRSSRN